MEPREIPLETRVDRAWYAWHCLPRQHTGEPHSEDWLRGQVEPAISKGLIGRAMREERDPKLQTWERIADALGVSRMWLIHGNGDRPKLSGQLRDRVEFYGLKTLAHDAPSRNPLEEAIGALVGLIGQETIDGARETFAGREHERPSMVWVTVLTRAEHARRGTPKRKPPPTLPPVAPTAQLAANDAPTKRKRRSA